MGYTGRRVALQLEYAGEDIKSAVAKVMMK